MASMGHDLRRGHAYRFDWSQIARSLVTAGFVEGSWIDRPVVAVPGVAPLFDAQTFDPGAWRPDIPFAPFEAADRYDAYWGTKLVAGFTRAQVRAAVEAGRFSDSRAVDYLTETLMARARKTEAYWFARVAPIEHVAIDRALCFDDLAIADGLALASATRYTLRTYDERGRRIAAPRAVVATGARTCLTAPAGADYTIFALETARGSLRTTTFVHTALDPVTHARRVIGLWRE
jgi:hypothetical protein